MDFWYLLPLRIVRIFGGFTFTDAADFGPLMLLLLGLWIAYALRCTALRPELEPELGEPKLGEPALLEPDSTEADLPKPGWPKALTAPRAKPLLMGPLLLLALWPLLPNLGLWLLAREVQRVRGGWPQVMIDDPKNLLTHVSARYDALFPSIGYLEAYSGAAMLVFFALFLAARSRFSPAQINLIWGVLVASFCFMLLDPGGLYGWWLD